MVKRITTEAYRLALPAAWQVHDVFHTSQLKAVEGRPHREEAVLLEDGQEEYEVESILSSRLVRGKR